MKSQPACPSLEVKSAPASTSLPTVPRREHLMSRYFVRTPDPADLDQLAQAYFGPSSLLQPSEARPYRSTSEGNVLLAELGPNEVEALRASGAEVFADFELRTFGPDDHKTVGGSEPRGGNTQPPTARGLSHVLEQIRAPEAWELSRGERVTIAVVDTGVCGSLREFPATQRSAIDLPTAFAGNHWADARGHGSMCAAIACGSRKAGGRFDGVAPGATLLSARTTLLVSDIYRIYDRLLALRADGRLPGPLVISNSFGLYSCAPTPGLPADHPYRSIVVAATQQGVPVVFAAGNNHYDVLCSHDPAACGPNTIWAVNSEDAVLSVGTVNADLTNQDPSTPHVNSSRGPGEWARDLPKPDCVAPTYGEVVWGCGYRDLPWWGTSGACPQVAGLAALILAVRPSLSSAEVGSIIRSTCRGLSAPHSCVGSGLIDCRAAVEAALAH
jgi:serine protease AprX